jgi:rSAM/selenodomain-associated transferase 1
VKPAVAVMAKVPGLETVKSRLHRSLGPEMATLLYRCFLLDRMDALARLPGILPLVAFTPAHGRPQMEALAPAGFGLVPQEGRDLGERLSRLLGGLIGQGHPGAIAVDSDSPTLPLPYVSEAAERLLRDDADAVLGPSEDGGYYLVGLRGPQPALFRDIPWSTDRVFDLTQDRARRLGLRVHVLPEWFDVDTETDLRRLWEQPPEAADLATRTYRCLGAIYT